MSSALECAVLHLGVSRSACWLHKSTVHLARGFIVAAGICSGASYTILRDNIDNFRSHGSRLALVGAVAAAPFVT